MDLFKEVLRLEKNIHYNRFYGDIKGAIKDRDKFILDLWKNEGGGLWALLVLECEIYQSQRFWRRGKGNLLPSVHKIEYLSESDEKKGEYKSAYLKALMVTKNVTWDYLVQEAQIWTPIDIVYETRWDCNIERRKTA